MVAVFMFSCALVAAPSLADPAANATLGITLDPVIGQHVEPGGTTNFDGTPLVTIEGSARYGNAELYAEGLPPIVPLQSGGTLGSLSTDLGFSLPWAAGISTVHVALVGARYINFAAASIASGSLADRNRGVPFTLGALARAGDASP